MVIRGRPLSEGFERTPTLRIFRGSRGGMWRQRHRAGRETHNGAGAELATEAYKGNRNRQGPSWESEGCIVPLEGRGQHNLARGKGPYFVHAFNEWRIRGLPWRTKSGVQRKGVKESAGLNRVGIGNERVLQRRPSQLLWPRTVRCRWQHRGCSIG